MILDNGFWAGLTLYPQTKVSAQRAVDMLEKYGPDRILVAGACDWGPSEPVAVPKFVMEMRRRKHSEAFIQRVVLENPDPVPQPVAEVQGAGRRRGSRARRASADGSRLLRISPDGSLHLTYCTNIHAADGWPAVFATLKQLRAGAQSALLAERAVRRRPSPVGARRARARRQWRRRRFASSSSDHGLYVAIINGFPHGSFHRSVVKADVYAPDWRDPERVRYTLDLIDILVGAPARRSRRRRVDGAAVVQGLDGERVDGRLAADRSRTSWTSPRRSCGSATSRGVFIHLDIEPEPDCVIETTDETIVLSGAAAAARAPLSSPRFSTSTRTRPAGCSPTTSGCASTAAISRSSTRILEHAPRRRSPTRASGSAASS